MQGKVQPFCQDGNLHVMWQIQISQAQPLCGPPCSSFIVSVIVA